MARRLTVEMRDRIREREVAEYHRLSQLESNKVAERERSGALMIGRNVLSTDKRSGVRLVRTQRSAQGLVKAPASVKEKGWNGVPQNMPANVYPNKDRHRRYVDTTQPLTTVRSLTSVEPSATPMYVGDLRASDINGRSEKFMALRPALAAEPTHMIVKRRPRV